PCQSCQIGKSLDSWSALDSANGANCDAGKVCQSGVCASACYIESRFYSPDENDNASPCGRCIPSKKTDGWSLRNECFKSIALGENHSCALVDTATVWCWGRNHLRQLGDEAGLDSTKPVRVVNSVRSTAIAAGSAHTCAIRDQLVFCWGGNSSGQIGNGTLSESQSLPLRVLDIARASAVATGNLHSCALDAVGAVRCWGDNQSGQLGSGSSDLNSARPMAVVGVDGSNDESTATAIAAGGAHSCALMLGGSVMCWGKNNAGQLGNGTNQDQRSPVAVSNLTDAVAIATGYAHSCAVLTGGGVKCWGSNTSGELGDGRTSSSNVPVQIGASYIDNATSITAGQNFTCVRLKTGALKCWGNDGSDQLGNGAGGGNAQPTPVAVLNVSTAIVVGAGASHACAGLAGGGLQCWGDNAYGQLGDGSKNDRDEPTSVLGF
ncbi:MAG TPA: hypothetical protein VKP30_08975, partial [Polyangiaceae bacterium]|nr:hypothetical protein [Polyangiaceae bacterium]